MGRFQYNQHDEAQEDDDDVADDLAAQDEVLRRRWQFVALPGEDGALVRRAREDEQSFHEEEVVDQREYRKERTVFVVYHQGSQAGGSPGNEDDDGRMEEYPYEDEDDDDFRVRTMASRFCPLWLRITLIALACQIMWYVLHNGPPAPPAGSLHDDATLTWADYLETHVSSLRQSATALFVALPYHILSWWSIHARSDMVNFYDEWTRPSPCQLEWKDLDLSTEGEDSFQTLLSDCFVFKSQPLALQKVAQALHAWKWDLEASRSRPLVLVVSSMTPGLPVQELGRCLVEKLLFPTCPTPPLASLSFHHDSAVMRDRLVQALTPWQGQGGLVLLPSVVAPHPSLEWLLQSLTGSVDPTELGWVSLLAQRTIFLIESPEIGRASLVRHLRRGGSPAADSPSLFLDLRHEWENSGVDAAGNAVAVPLFAMDRPDLNKYVYWWLGNELNWNIAITDDFNKGLSMVSPRKARTSALVSTRVAEALTSPDVVEYVQWSSSDANGQQSTVLTFSTAGVLSVENKLQGLTRKFLAHERLNKEKTTDKTLWLLDYESDSGRMMLKLCESMRVSSCSSVTSFSI
jgi:hypothetical protein